MRLTSVTHEFVEKIPQSLQEGKIYVSIPYATAVHKCCCGCGNEVVTPIGPTDWELTFNGETISLDPSIGNWNFPCQSHYWIKGNKVRWVRGWTREEIAAGRAKERAEKEKYYGIENRMSPGKPKQTFWSKFKKWVN